MTTFKKRIEKFIEHKTTAIIRQRFEDAGIKWEAEFTIDVFVELLCILNQQAPIKNYRIAERNNIKPVI